MNLQLDMFAAGETHTLPPWDDPEVCRHYECTTETDCDHVGAGEVGRVGKTAPCIVVRAVGANDQTLRAWRFEASEQRRAYEFATKQQAVLTENRQTRLL